MILLGHLHTHEFAVGGTTDQVGNPWALERSAGGSSGGSAAALAARMVPAATGTDTAGSLRIPSACCGTSTIKPTRGLVSMRGDRAARHEPRPRRADGADARGLRAAPGRDGGTGPRPSGQRAGGLAARRAAGAACGRHAARRCAPRTLAPHRPRCARRRRRRRLRRRDRRAAPRSEPSSSQPPAPRVRAGRRRRLPRRPLRRAARLPPPLRRPARALPAVAARVGRAGRGARRLGRALSRGAGAPPRDDGGASRGGSRTTGSRP